jgi:hypothetical protein
MKRFMSKKLLVVGVAVALALGIGGAAFAFFTSSGGGTGSAQVGTASNLSIHQDGATVYDSTIAPLPGNTYSFAYEATGTYEFGNEITPVASTSPLDTVVVDMSSWACETGSGATCATTPGATFPVAITFDIFNPASPTAAAIATDTQTFNIPFRPSSVGCPSDNTAWLDATTNTCNHGLLTPITFNFSSQDFVLPSTLVYGIEFNTADYGPIPTGNESAPYNSLNVGLSTESTNVTVGNDTEVGNVFVAGKQGDIAPGEVTCSNLGSGFAQYSTAAGTNPSSPNPGNACGFGSTWNIPAVQFNVTNPASPDLYPGGAPQPINFTVDNLGSVPAHVGSIGISVAYDPANGYVESTPGDTNTDVVGCNVSWFGFNNVPVVINTNIPVGPTDYPSTSTGASIYMGESGTNQDACQGAALGLVFTSS